MRINLILLFLVFASISGMGFAENTYNLRVMDLDPGTLVYAKANSTGNLITSAVAQGDSANLSMPGDVVFYLETDPDVYFVGVDGKPLPLKEARYVFHLDQICVADYSYCSSFDYNYMGYPLSPQKISNDQQTKSCFGPGSGGYDLFSKGSIIMYGESYPRVAEDVCLDDRTARKYWCDNTLGKSTDVSCPEGHLCWDGYCFKGTQFVQCTDSDGYDIFRKGMVRVTNPDGDFDFQDYCDDDLTIVEHTCPSPDDIADSKYLTCPFGYKCSDGACVEDTCTDSDGGKNYYTKGEVFKAGNTYIDRCEDGKLVEVYCDPNGNYLMDVFECPVNYYCSYGECEQSDNASGSYASIGIGVNNYPETNDSAKATNIDGWVNMYKVNKARNGFEGNLLETKQAFATSGAVFTIPYAYDYDPPYVVKFRTFKSYDKAVATTYITFNTQPYQNLKYRPYGYDTLCIVGFGTDKCHSSSSIPYSDDEGSTQKTYSCSDTDSDNIYEKGTVTLAGTDFTDYCDPEGKVAENECMEGEYTVTFRECPTGYICSDGACKKNEMDELPDGIGVGTAISIYPGWNMFSIPSTTEHVTSNCTGFDADSVWMYYPFDKKYIHPANLAPGDGYWFYSNELCRIEADGTAVSPAIISLQQGWNLIGSASDFYPFDEIKGTCNFIKGPYSFNTGSQSYQPATTLMLGNAYFIKVVEPCRFSVEEKPPPPPEVGT